MPQMSPLLWLNLYIFFFSVFVLFIVMSYFTYSPIMKEEKTLSLSKQQMNWKW
uniref:ATP synthase F0 subunit 8 n=1 Tax=Hemisquilla californiensis TaxID=870559 RepID=UPI001EA7FD78|nr:ATP synthase F0 subunit 8 [Hemisquilla californiensis]UGW52185.1 ATP synthase F0 subunit 8 [Hemisquilla californiensis]